jgi:hypothetical protein
MKIIEQVTGKKYFGKGQRFENIVNHYLVPTIVKAIRCSKATLLLLAFTLM